MSPLFAAVRRAALLCLPFAAIFVAGVTLSPHADAQYPGGGSGSGYPGGPAPGWHPVKPDGTLGNDVLNTDANFSVYDSTRHVMAMKVDGQQSQTANYQLFYTGTAINHPNSDSYNSPDWYYYYSGVYTPFSAANPAHYEQSSSSSDVSLTEGTSPFTVHMKDSAYSTSYNTNGLRVFDINPNFPRYVRYIGFLNFPNGIMQFIHETAHERGHQYLWQLGTEGPIYTDVVSPTNIGSTNPNSSEDGDIVVDNWEAAHHLNAGASDTTSAYANSGANDAGDGDGELLADIQALAVVFNQFSDWQQDWADGGVQKGAQPFLVPDPSTGIAPGFSLLFTPTSGPSYYVKNLSDLPAGTITSLSQLGP